MNCTSRGIRAAARSLRQPANRQPRRFASHGADHGHGAAGHGESALHVAGGSGSEGFGNSLYWVLGGVPVIYVTYLLASGSDNFLSRGVQSFLARGAIESQKTSHNIAAVQQAVDDRNLFRNQPIDTRGPDLRWPERFNVGSQINVNPGHRANLEELAEFYEKKHQAMDEDRIARTKARVEAGR